MPYPDFSPATSQVAATSVSWNSNGTMIAVSYGHIDHEGWCVHSGSLCIWNIFSRKMNPKKPFISVDTQVYTNYVCNNKIYIDLFSNGRIS